MTASATGNSDPLYSWSDVFDVISVVIIFFVGEVLLSRLLFNWNIRDHPY